ncbi:MAG: hypothetical protein NZ585_09625 [Chloracidobacterium sp.]|nr:hypothetical protein [Chloracidobacterium sp.]MDW8216962.1 hypothetical protein [Acidobacteriota bacterium]
MRLLLRLSLLSLVCFTPLLWTIPTAAQNSSGKPLSLEQIKRLIQNDFPDTALAGEIRDRGIDFSDTFDRQTLESLRLLGAQEKTLRALEPYLPKAAVRIVTKLDRTTVFIDGKQYGVTDSTGILQINDLEPGEHLIETRNRPKYKDGQRRVVLRPRDNQEVVFEPELNVGSLTITPLTPNMDIRVYNELTSLTGVFAKRELAPGVYTLQARSRWYRPITQIIQIQSGQHLTLPIELELDETLIEDAINEARKSFSSRDYSKAVNTLLEVLTVAPRHLAALNVLAHSYLRLNDTPNFIATAKRILDADGTLDFTLLLHNEKKAPQPVRLQLSRSSLMLEHLDTGETQTFPLEAFSRAFIRGDVQSEVFLVLAGARSPKRLPDLQFAMGNSYDPRNDSGEVQLSQRDKINILWNIEEILRFSLEVHREFLAVNPSRATTLRPASGASKPTSASPPTTSLPDTGATTVERPTPALDNTPSESAKTVSKDAKQPSKGKQPKPKAAQGDAAVASQPAPQPTSDAPASDEGETAANKAKETSQSKGKQPKPKATQEKVAAASQPTPVAADDVSKSASAPVRARALIGTMLGAVGGRANIERIAAAQFSGTQIIVEPALAAPEVAPDPKPIRQFWTRNKRLRFEVAPGSPTGLVFLRMERTFQQRVNGRVERISQPETLKQIRMQSKLAGVGLYQQLLAPGNAVVRFSRHLADGRVEETIRVTDGDGDTYDVVIDLETYRPVKCAYELPTALGRPLQIEERYEDFKPVNDIWLPHRIVRSVQGGRTVTLTFTDIQLPPGLSEDLFRRP